MARRSDSPLEDVLDITSKLPWWVGVSFALISYFFLHWYAIRELPTGSGADAIGKAAAAGLFHGLAALGQYLLPIFFLIAASLSAFKTFKRNKLFKDASNSPTANSLEKISWQEFELLVGEYFRRNGYSISETSSGADGGVDLIALKNGEKHLIQCKQWKAYKVGVKVVRELLGVMVCTGAAGGFVVTSGQFTKDAVAFARDNNIKLFNGKILHQEICSKPPEATIESDVKPKSGNVKTVEKVQNADHRTCPKCGNKMVLRIAKRGNRAGKKFFGCSRFPDCKGVLPL